MKKPLLNCILLSTLLWSFANAASGQELFVYEVCQEEGPLGQQAVLHLSFRKGLNLYEEKDPVCLVKTPIAQGTFFSSAKVSEDSSGIVGVTFTMTQQGRKVFSDLSRKYVFRRIALVVDRKVITLPTFVEPVDEETLHLAGMGQTTSERIAALFNR